MTLYSEIALRNIEERWADGEYEVTPNPLYVNALREAYETGVAFLEEYDNPESRGDISNAAREDLVELRGTVVEVAPHFGVDLEIASAVSDAE